MQAKKNCSAEDIYAILQDYYEQLAEMPEPALAARPEPPLRRLAFKRKKNKLGMEGGAAGGRPPTESVPLSSKYFGIFAKGFESLDELLKEVDALNKNCEREVDPALQEVS